ncbi:hypothetical protein [Candidatus Bandiella numerosa]|uniref:hypothetical protein n=1 Tax=Candidatus Bandiella numerosa TaxID=2570586 RepID=UPI001F3B4493|nr:hypothetical protein [Candidatus Bandiella numerosa]
MALPLQNSLPNIASDKWRRYYYESRDRYYIVILQQDLFHEWSIVKCYGGKENKLGNCVIESGYSYEEAINRIKAIEKTRKAHKYMLK